ncbi:1,4-alpha-glucan branching protein GlgB [Roseateles amylovorans]|uniref:1,4-alpha-glucan branching enzyme GlgB n=1 Tax=Roseateles amylovorans TaxID=2978473 RepID=A0ABY6AUW2_9BURK|nr:1,4-alpha-glucan branching protein GlgB [Roseateles amylovorans]UXH76365.1 1,4-alpha-glucan branching protein GlgB [Roseateles amylovorans]
MLADEAIQALLQARHGDPFAVLGLHEADDGSGRLWVRTVQPGARSVSVLDADSGKRLGDLAEPAGPGSGFFELPVPRRRKRFDYRLAVTGDDGVERVLPDAYAFGALLPEVELALLARGEHPRPWLWLGAHPMAVDGVDGVRFAVWAPAARRVSVVGDFNRWDGRRHPMRRRHEAGVWEIFIPKAKRGQFYKFELLDGEGRLLPLKADPYAFRAQMRPENASVIAGLPAPMGLSAARAAANRRDAPISIYELHPMSWRRTDDGFPDWALLTRELPGYAAGLGFTHVELMPITEHPFDASWGYQTLGLHAPTARLGDPDGLRRFVRACHAAGLGVLLDFVPAHFPEDPHGLGKFDGTPLYEYADPREGWHRDWHTLIYDFGKPQVRQFLAGAALFWAERYGLDGLRVDAVASMLYRDYSRPPGEWIPNIHGGRENLEAIALLRHTHELLGREAPGFITIAEESTAFPGVSAPTSLGGLGFHYKWNMGWMNDTLHYMREQPIHRRWHHEKISFGLVYAFNENFVLPLSHDEVVHGKGSLLGKMPGEPGDPADWQRFAHLRSYYGFMWAHPGKKLLFMGQEFGQRSEWNFEQPLPWALVDDERHAGVLRLVGDLNRLYRAQPALHRKDCDSAGFEWLQAEDREQSVFAFARYDDDERPVVAICNFTPVPRERYRIPLPTRVPDRADSSSWRVLLDTDARRYGGSGIGDVERHMEVTDGELVLDLPPLATIFLGRV